MHTLIQRTGFPFLCKVMQECTSPVYIRLRPVTRADQFEIHAVAGMILNGLVHRLFVAVITDFINHQDWGEWVQLFKYFWSAAVL